VSVEELSNEMSFARDIKRGDSSDLGHVCGSRLWVKVEGHRRKILLKWSVQLQLMAFLVVVGI